MIWFLKRCRHRETGELNRIATLAEHTAEAAKVEARETARRVEPTLSSLERRKRENAIYASVMDSLRGHSEHAQRDLRSARLRRRGCRPRDLRADPTVVA